MRTITPQEGRVAPRLPVDSMLAAIRRKGRLAKAIGVVVDFNRFGLAIVTDQPFAKETLVYLSIQTNSIKIDNLVGVVHNCISQETGYRCGIQFRTSSPLQDEPGQIEQKLAEMELCLDASCVS